VAILLEMELGGHTLEYFKILYVGIFGVNIKLDFRHGYIEINAVEDLTKSCAVI
jgi:hypothetical protein